MTRPWLALLFLAAPMLAALSCSRRDAPPPPPAAGEANAVTWTHNIFELQEDAERDDELTLLAKLAEYDGKLDTPGFRGRTLLTLVCSRGQTEVVKYLLGKDSGINRRNNNWHSPLMLAALANHGEVVALLLAARADKTLTDERGNNVLALAAAAGHAEIVDQLIKAGMDVNRRNQGRKESRPSTNETALHHAATAGRLEAAKVLVARGAALSARTVRGETPLWLAQFHGHEALATYLAAQGAQADGGVAAISRESADLTKGELAALSNAHQMWYGDHLKLVDHVPKFSDLCRYRKAGPLTARGGKDPLGNDYLVGPYSSGYLDAPRKPGDGLGNLTYLSAVHVNPKTVEALRPFTGDAEATKAFWGKFYPRPPK